MSCGVGLRCGSDLAFLWLRYRPAATDLIQPLAWELPYAAGAALTRQKKKKKKFETRKKKKKKKKKNLKREKKKKAQQSGLLKAKQKNAL